MILWILGGVAYFTAGFAFATGICLYGSSRKAPEDPRLVFACVVLWPAMIVLIAACLAWMAVAEGPIRLAAWLKSRGHGKPARPVGGMEWEDAA